MLYYKQIVMKLLSHILYGFEDYMVNKLSDLVTPALNDSLAPLGD